MREHEAGRARVVPVLLENVPGWRKAPFARLELLPTKGRAVAQWRDPVAAFADVARGIGRVAKDIIVAGGGRSNSAPTNSPKRKKHRGSLQTRA